jgi:iturin family lipopeptide synthetase A
MAEPIEDRRAYEIAIVGAAGRFPRAGDLAELWDRLRQGEELISVFSPAELLAAGVPEELLRHPRYVRARGALAGSDLFDAAFFGFTPREAEITSPQHRLFLETCWHALEDAGCDPARLPGATGDTGNTGAIGVFASGSSCNYFFDLYAQPGLVASVGSLRVQIANEKEFLPTWASYKLDLKGPSINVQTACSSSLVAVHMACQSLLNRECDLALAGGVSVRYRDAAGYLYEEGGILSPDGHCRAFDAAAAGTLDGDGVGVVVLKRLLDALEDGDPIRAVIKGSAVNNDGAGKIGFTAPGPGGQTRVIAEALAVAGVDPATVSYVEAHGTGTRLGDPIEIAALNEAFRARTAARGFCAVGSVKTNMGHLDAAAGIAGLIKTMLALEHRTLPPSLHFFTPNPEIDFAGSPFYVNARPAPWEPPGGVRRAGVSAFGIGGTNAHVIVEEAPRRESDPGRPWQLLVWSARTAAARAALGDRLAARWAERDATASVPRSLADDAFTLQQGRRAFGFRAALVCRDADAAAVAAAAVAALRQSAPGAVSLGEAPIHPRPVAFVLPGQGTQKVGVAAELYAEEEVFRTTVERCSELLRPALGRDLTALLYPLPADREEAQNLLGETAWAQPAVFVLGYALARLWMSWGVRPRALLGHSLGEYVAACLSGVMSLPDALTLVSHRARLMQSLPRGGMLAVSLAAADVEALCGGSLSLAAINGPERSVVSGPLSELDGLERRLIDRRVPCRRLQVSHAFHSSMIDPVLPLFEEQLRRIVLHPPEIPFLSSVTGRWITPEEATDVAYWCRQMRDTVLFGPAAGVLLGADAWALLEVGSGETLSGLLKRHPDLRPDHRVVASLTAGAESAGGERAALLQALGRLWVGGVEVDWAQLHRGERRLRVALPGYPFERQPYRVRRVREVEDPSSVATAERNEEVSMAEVEASRSASALWREGIVQALFEMIHELTGAEPGTIEAQASFLDLGVDSLLLIQATQKLQDRFGLRISLVQLLEELTTLAAVADYLVRELPRPAEPAPAPQPLPTPIVTAAVGLPSVSPTAQMSPISPTSPTSPMLPPPEAASGIERLFAQQLQIMAQQIDLLRGSAAAPAPAAAAPPAPIAAPAVTAPTAGPEPPRSFTGFGPYQPIETGPAGELTAVQRRYLDGFIARYVRRTAKSRETTEASRRVLADGRASVGFRRLWKDLVYPIHGDRMQGTQVWDVDGNPYTDICMGFGVHFFGHSPDFVVAAMERQLRHGMGVGPQSSLAGEVAGMIAAFTGLDRVAFCNSGTEAVMGALRAARTYTRRSKIALFSGSYHGWADATLARTQVVKGRRVSLPLAPGVSTTAVEDVLVLDYGTAESLEILKAEMGGLAAVLVEPMQSRRPDFAPREFLHELRRLTAAAGTVLIFDEMITGFRLHPAGAQGWFGIQADLAVYGKLIANGLPIGVLAGGAPFMNVLDGGPWTYGDDSYPRAEKTMFAGAFFKHPLTMSTARAVLGRMREEGPGLFERLNARTARLCADLNAVFATAGAPITAVHAGSLFRFRFAANLPYADLFPYHLIDHGIFYSLESGNCFLTPAHSEEDLARVKTAVARSVEELRQGGFLPGSTTPGGGGGRAAVFQAPIETARAAPSPPAPLPVPLPAGRGVDFGLYYFGSYDAAFDPAKYRLLFEGAKLADRLGFSAVWLPERHFHSFGGLSPNPSVLAAALARETRRIQLRAGSVVLPLHDPIRVAEDWSLVDNLSDGRAGVSFASGWHPDDFALAPTAYAGRHEAMRRGIETVRRLWRGEPLAVTGGTGQPLDVRLFPLPKRAEIPIWLSGTSTETFELAGQLGAGVVTNLQVLPIDELAQRVALYHQALAAAGFDRQRARVTVLLHTYLASDAATARETARRPFCNYLHSNLGLVANQLASGGRPIDLDRVSPESLDELLNRHYERWSAGSTLIGSVESVAEIVEKLARAGATELGCLIDFGIDPDLVLASLEPLDRLRRRSAGSAGPAASVGSAASSPPPAPRHRLTEAQKALWFLTQMGSDASRAYNESITLHLAGPLVEGALAGALTTVLARHEALRIEVSADGEFLSAAPARPVPLPRVDLSALPEPRREEEAERRTLAWAQEPLDLAVGLLLRAALLHLGGARHRLVVTTHHLAVDGHAMGVLVSELAALYTAACEGSPALLPPPGRLGDVAAHSASDDPDTVMADEDYWAARLTPPPPVLALPLDRPRPAVKGYAVARYRRRLDGEIARELRSFSREQKSTLFMTLLAGFKVLLYQLTGQRDLVVGVNASPMSSEADRALVGFRVNALPLRSEIAPDEPLPAYLARLKRLVAEGYTHQAFSPHRVLRRLGLKRDPSRFPLVSVVFDLERSGAAPRFAGLAVEVDANPVGAKVDLYVNVTESAEGLEVRCDFDADLFATATVAGWLAHYERLLRAVVATPEQAIDDLPRPVSPGVAGVAGVVAPSAGPASNLSRYQQLLWMSQKLAPEAPLLANGGVARLPLRIDREIFARAVASVVAGSDALRTVIEEIDGVPCQRVRGSGSPGVDFTDLSARPEPFAAARSLALARCRRPHALDRSLLDVALYRLGEEDFLWYANVNHLVADAWAVSLVLDAISRAYQALLAGEAPPPPTPAFADYLAEERGLAGSEEARQAEAYWREKLARPVDPLTFYGAPAARRAGPAEQVVCDLGPERTARLRRLAADEPFYFASVELSLLSLVGALVATWLARTGGSRALSLGVPFHNRLTAAARRTIGLFMQILPVHLRLDAKETFPSLAEKLALESLESVRFRQFSVGNQLHRRAYEVELNYMPVGLATFAGVAVESEWFQPAETTSESLAVQILDRGESLVLRLSFHGEVFAPRQRQLALGHILRVVDALLENPARPIDSFALQSAEERLEIVAGWNAAARELPLEESFAAAFVRQVERTPGRPAVTDDLGTFTYRELQEKAGGLAGRLAGILAAAGVGPESVVAILAPRDRTFLAAMLAVFHAGGAYLPLDPAHPERRLRQILDQSGAPLVLVAAELHSKLLAALDGGAVTARPQILVLQEGLGNEGSLAPCPSAPGDLQRLAYVIYTSGSTGAPKGAMVEQAGMMNHLYAKVAALGLGGEDAVAQTASQCFDISVWQLLAPLLVGGRTRIYSEAAVRDPASLLSRFEADGITVAETVPSLLRALLDEVETAGVARPALAALRFLLATGEALPADFCRRWLGVYPAVPLVNAYGPTECSDDVTHHVLTAAPEGETVPVGRPIANLHLSVVDRGGLPEPAGVAGELWIGGAGVGRGYLHDPARTAEAFVPDDLSGEPGGRVYRSGDLCRFRLDGSLDFLGRIDHQVKIRGQRIELGEIEIVLRRHEAVREAAVLVRRDGPGEPLLAAYLVFHPGASATPGALRGFLQERLPDAMVPAAFVVLPALPVTPNGKVDRAALPAPEMGREALESARSAMTAPRNALEARLAAIWREVLGLAEISVHDNFFELGGDSILSIQIASLATRAGLRLSPLQLFEHPTVARLSEALEEMPEDAVVLPVRSPEDLGPVVGPMPLTPIQRRFFTLDIPTPHHWNQALLLEVAIPLVPRALAAALAGLLVHHDALRHRFKRGAEGWEQVATPPAPPGVGEDALSGLDLTALPAFRQSPEVERAAAALQGSLHLAAGPLLRCATFTLGAGQRLLLLAHHLVVDGVSWRILLEDLESAYRQAERGAPVVLPAKTTSFKRWAERLAQHAASPALAAEEPYWLDEARRGARPLPLDFAGAGGDNTRASTRSLSVALDAAETRALLREVPTAFHTQINDLLLAALAEAFAGWTGGGPLLVDLEGHGREEIAGDVDLSRTVGWFTALFPLLLDARPELTPELRLAAVQAALRAVPQSGIGYGLLRYGGRAETAARLAALPAAEISFNYLGQLDQAFGGESPFRPAAESAGPAAGPGGRRSHRLEINGFVASGELRFDWAYSPNLDRAETVLRWAREHMEALRRWIARSRGAAPDLPSLAAAADFDWSPEQMDEIAAVLSLGGDPAARQAGGTVER